MSADEQVARRAICGCRSSDFDDQHRFDWQQTCGPCLDHALAAARAEGVAQEREAIAKMLDEDKRLRTAKVLGELATAIRARACEELDT